MKFLSLFFCLLSMSALAQSEFRQYTGCYQTLEHNGEPIPANPTRDLVTKISDQRHDYFFTDPDQGSKIPAVMFSIYEGHFQNPTRDKFRLAYGYLDRGTYSSDGISTEFLYQGDLYSLREKRVFKVTR